MCLVSRLARAPSHSLNLAPLPGRHPRVRAWEWGNCRRGASEKGGVLHLGSTQEQLPPHALSDWERVG